MDKFRSDIAQLEAQLAAAIEERAKLQREIATMKRDAESTWAAERVENALLRERINDVAAEVARLTAALEGPGSPIESMLAVEAPALGQAMDQQGPSNGPSNGQRHVRQQRRPRRGRARQDRLPAGKQEHARRPHPRAAVERLARRLVELEHDREKSLPVFGRDHARQKTTLA